MDGAVERRPRFEQGILYVAFFLMGLGAVLVYSATVYTASLPTDPTTAGDGVFFLRKHLTSLAFGMVFLAITTFLPFEWFRRLAVPALVGGILSMVAVLLVGEERLGAVRWFRIGGFWAQPGEVVKLAFVVWMSYSLTKKADTIRRFSVGVLPHFLAALLLALLFVAQPDLGSAALLFVVLVALLYISGTKWQYIASVALVGMLATSALILTSEERMSRVRTWLDPDQEPEDSWQLKHAKAGIAAGGLTGQGLGSGKENVAGYVPQRESDFIFAVLGEETGFLGCLLVVAAYAYILWRGMLLAARVKDPFARYLAAGCVLVIVLQAAVNIGVASGLLPTKGLTAPLLSSGGSSILVICCCIGIVLNVSRTQPRLVKVSPDGNEAVDASVVYVREGA
jgi:cell division protein FtsW